MDPSLLQHRRVSALHEGCSDAAENNSNGSVRQRQTSGPQRRRRKKRTTSESPLTRVLVLLASIVIVVLIRAVYIRLYRPDQTKHRNNNNTQQQDRGSSFRTANNAFETTTTRVSNNNNNTATTIPFVYMVYNRVDYMRQALESLLKSDFTLYDAPIIISHDGNNQDMQDYISDFQQQHPGITIHNLIHPHHILCINRKDKTHTCTKHHFTWMLRKVFDDYNKYSAFLFMEEDYEVAPTIYQTLLSGLNILLLQSTNNTNNESLLFGVTLDRTKRRLMQRRKHVFVTDDFVSGPMLLQRTMLQQFLNTPSIIHSYCTFNDYNWDWSVVHVQQEKLLPSKVLVPSLPQVRHIGKVGMHHGNSGSGLFSLLRGGNQQQERKTIFGSVDRQGLLNNNRPLQEFHGTELYTTSDLLVDKKLREQDVTYGSKYTQRKKKNTMFHQQGDDDKQGGARLRAAHRPPIRTTKQPTTKGHIDGYGGWDDPVDQQHCLDVLQG